MVRCTLCWGADSLPNCKNNWVIADWEMQGTLSARFLMSQRNEEDSYCHYLFQQAKEISVTQTTVEQLWFPACSCCIVLEAKKRWQTARPHCTAALGTHRTTAIHPADNESTGSGWLLTLRAGVITWSESLLGAGMSGCSAVSTSLAWPTSRLHSSNKASGLTDASPQHSL